jgi:hypothetical protein
MPDNRTKAGGAIAAGATVAAVVGGAIVLSTGPTNGQQEISEKEIPCVVVASPDTDEATRTQTLQSMPLYFQVLWENVVAKNMTIEEFLADCRTEVYAR